MAAILAMALVASCPSVDTLTLEEKVGQTLIVHFNGQMYNGQAETLLNDVHVGGFIYYNWANGLTSPLQVQKLSNELQQHAKGTRSAIPLFIACDQEGGLVQRLRQGFTTFSGNRALGAIDDLELTEQVGYAMGQELHAVGVNFNLAPCVDVAATEHSSMAKRSFGSDASKVAQHGQRMLKGFRRASVIGCLKHFPGHGNVTVDSHENLPILNKSIGQLQECDLVPFSRLAAICDSIMTAHIMVPALDNKNCATLSKPILEQLLRKELSFKGVVVSDSLVMQGVLKTRSSIDQAAIDCFNAGCDLIMLGGKQLIGSKTDYELTPEDIKRIVGRLVAAVRSGEIAESRLNASVERILQLKSRYGLFSQPLPTEEEIAAHVGTKEHQLLAQTVVDRSRV